jgi:ABC-2 type transport system permease protein
MIAAIRSEVRKLLSVRSTYGCVIASMLIIILFAGIAEGFLANAESLRNPGLLASESVGAIVFAGLIVAIPGLLLFGNEYRYNTIMYTLTSSNRRLKVLGSKALVITVFAVLASILVTFFSPLCTFLGIQIAGFCLRWQSCGRRQLQGSVA